MGVPAARFSLPLHFPFAFFHSWARDSAGERGVDVSHLQQRFLFRNAHDSQSPLLYGLGV